MIPQLPFGDDDFTHIQTHADFLYVDKTRRIAELFAPGRSRHLFLARPRRFGKTLLLSTVEALFQGRRDLFVDTWIGQEGHWDWEGRTRPVLRLDLDVRDLYTPADVRTALRDEVDDQALLQDIVLPPGAADRALRRLLRHMASATGRKVVVLVDEYDTAITENLHRPEVLEDVLNVLRAFYGALKASSRFIECTLVTGITRLARAGLFSGANHLTDLSHEPEANELLGFTQAELHAPRVAALVAEGARHLGCPLAELYAALEREYNGYRFAAGQESVYNPYTLAGCLYALVKPGAAALWSLDSLPRCWAETGTPKVLLRGLHARRLQSLPDWDRQDVRPLTRVSFDVSKPDLTALMLQAGYLALDAAIPPVLVFPNREVQAAFAESLMEWFTETAPTWLESSMFPRVQRAAQLQDALRRQDAVALRHVVASGLEAVPRIMYQFGDKHVRPHEPFYQALLYVLCQSLELPLAAELPAGLGRVDLALELPGRICLLELKVNHAPETALRQAFRNFYAAPYAPRALPVTVWGLQFNRDTCTLQACQAWDLGRFDARTGHWENEPYPISLAELHQWSVEERRAYMSQTPLRETPPIPQSDSLSGSQFPIS